MKKQSQIKINEIFYPVTEKLSTEEESKFIAMQTHPQPTEQDKLEAQVLYTALMTDTLIEE